jgi:hypothetical protein
VNMLQQRWPLPEGRPVPQTLQARRWVKGGAAGSPPGPMTRSTTASSSSTSLCGRGAPAVAPLPAELHASSPYMLCYVAGGGRGG